MPYPFLSLMAICVFMTVHLVATKVQKLDFLTHGRLLSLGGGIAIAYVFIDLLPKLSKSDFIVTQALSGVFPYFERHVYIMALLGFLLFFVVDRVQKPGTSQTALWLSLFSYSLFNFLIGYAVADKDNPEVKPLVLFTLALALHFLANDYALNSAHGDEYKKFGKWILITFLFLGWLTGILLSLESTSVALISAFIGGGVIMNVTRHELPKDNPHSLPTFLFAAIAYTAILLTIGS